MTSLAADGIGGKRWELHVRQELLRSANVRNASKMYKASSRALGRPPPLVQWSKGWSESCLAPAESAAEVQRAILAWRPTWWTLQPHHVLNRAEQGRLICRDELLGSNSVSPKEAAKTLKRAWILLKAQGLQLRNSPWKCRAKLAWLTWRTSRAKKVLQSTARRFCNTSPSDTERRAWNADHP